MGVYKPNHDVRYDSMLKVSRNIAVKAAGVGKMVVGLTSSIKMGGKHEEASEWMTVAGMKGSTIMPRDLSKWYAKVMHYRIDVPNCVCSWTMYSSEMTMS